MSDAPAGTPIPDQPLGADETYDCPRCHNTVTERFRGAPCSECRSVLRATIFHEHTDKCDHATTERYEPKLNVNPNNITGKAKRR